MHKQTVVFPYNGTLLTNKKECTIDAPNNINRSQNNFTKSKITGKEFSCGAVVQGSGTINAVAWVPTAAQV